ncbi:MAG TPA: NTP transferase domain-containing protein [Pseudonocardiaceae bacterium]|jgi:nicotine blue oxidoreductase
MTAGLLLAAGAGRRYGGPKALAHGGEWLRRALAALADGGCEPVRVVLGAAAERVVELLPAPEMAIVATDWERGMSASLRAGLDALAWLVPQPAAALVHLVDLPDVGAAVVRRIVGHATPTAVARATFDGAPGHPVLIGRHHWAAVAVAATGDRGARDWLADRRDVLLVECADLATGRDRDVPDDTLLA